MRRKCDAMNSKGMGTIAKMYHDVEDDGDDLASFFDFFAFAFCDFDAIVEIDLKSLTFTVANLRCDGSCYRPLPY